MYVSTNKKSPFWQTGQSQSILCYRKTDLVLLPEVWLGNGLPVLGVGVVCTLVILIMHLETMAKNTETLLLNITVYRVGYIINPPKGHC